MRDQKEEGHREKGERGGFEFLQAVFLILVMNMFTKSWLTEMFCSMIMAEHLSGSFTGAKYTHCL